MSVLDLGFGGCVQGFGFRGGFWFTELGYLGFGFVVVFVAALRACKFQAQARNPKSQALSSQCLDPVFYFGVLNPYTLQRV